MSKAKIAFTLLKIAAMVALGHRAIISDDGWYGLLIGALIGSEITEYYFRYRIHQDHRTNLNLIRKA